MRFGSLLLAVIALAGTVPEAAAEGPSGHPLEYRCILIDGTLRQTEDPLSPECVASWDGDNGGATAPGVTGDEINVILYNDLNIQGDLSTPYSSSQETVCPVVFECQNLVRTIKAHLNFFQERFATYGRVVHLFAEAAGCSGDSCTDQAREGDALTILQKYQDRGGIFATVFLGDNAEAYWEKMAENEVLTLGVNFSASASLYEENAPHVWSIMPDLETEIAASADYLCRKLAGRPARLSPDPTVQGRERRFGLIYEDSRGDLRPQVGARLLEEEVRQRCGIRFVGPYDYQQSATPEVEAALYTLYMMVDGVTTIVCYCLPGRFVAGAQASASAMAYFPEWYWDQQSAMDRDIWQRLYFDRRQANFGSTYFWRQPAFRDQFHYRAFQEEMPGSTPNSRFSWRSYHMLQQLFTAIQVAGPFLDVDAVETGLSGFEVRRPDDPFVPSGGYGDGGASPYTFIDTFMGWWFDPTGTPPGGRPAEGCTRVADDGLRASEGTWPAGDQDLFDPASPCTAGVYKLEDL